MTSRVPRPKIAMRCLAMAVLGVAILWGPAIAEEFGPEPLKPAAPGEGVPKLQITEVRWDWGEVYQGENVEHTFEIKNVGDGTLRILKVKPG